MSRTHEQALASAWLSASRRGFRELSLGRFESALSCWRDAAQVLASEALSDPTSAAAKNNAGVACLLLSRRNEAGMLLTEAHILWGEIRNRLGAMDVPVTGRSSSFHLRLAIDHSEAFMSASRKRYEQLCDAALAITQFNAWLAEQRPIGHDDYEVIIERLSRGFGSRCLQSGVLNRLSRDPDHALSDDADRRTPEQFFGAYSVALSRRIADEQSTPQTSRPTDAQKLEIAAHTTALCDPRLIAERPTHDEQCHR